MPSDLFASFSELLNLVSELCLGSLPYGRFLQFQPFQKKSHSAQE